MKKLKIDLLKSFPKYFVEFLIPSLGILLPLACSQFFNDYYVVTKWAVLYVYTVFFSIIICLKVRREKVVFCVMLDRKYYYLIGAICVLSMLNMFFRGSPAMWDFVLDVLVYIFTLFYIVIIHKNNFEKMFINFSLCTFVSIILLIILVILQLSGVFSSILLKQDFSLTFGNANMLSQYLGLSVPLIWFWISKNDAKNKFVQALYFFIIASLFYFIFDLNCRSIVLALTVSFLTVSVFNKTYRKISILFFLVFALNYTIKSFSKNTGLYSNFSNKDTSFMLDQVINENPTAKGTTYIRKNLYIASWEMIKSKPLLGWGKDSFSFSSTPFLAESQIINEKLYFNNPHNEFLRLAIEFGIPFFLIFSIILFFLLATYLKKVNFQTPLSACFLSIVIILFFEFTIQFPLYNATTFLLITVISGGIILQTYDLKEITVKPISLSIVISVSLILALLVLAKNFSAYTFANSKHNKKLDLACRVWPSHWIPCILKAKQDIRYRRYAEAENTLNSVLSFHSNHFTAIYLKTILHTKKNQTSKACESAAKYDSIFLNKSKLNEFRRLYCK